MCPSIAVLAGGGDGGGGSGSGAGDGSGDNQAGGSGSGDSAESDQRGAPDYAKYPVCGYASHPVDVVTGRAFTHPITDLELPGPLPFTFQRMYSSKMAARDTGLGFGWAHTLGWEIAVTRRRITVWNEQGIAVDFPMIPVGGETLGPWGWVVRRESWGFLVDAEDGLWHIFSLGVEGGKRYRLTAIEDRNKNRITVVYEDGKLVEVKDSAGRVIRIQTDAHSRITSLRVQNAFSQGQWVTFASYAYDARGDLVSATDAEGHAARYAYDDDHRLTADTDRTGLTFHFVYDGEGRCVESWGDYPGRNDPSLVDDVPTYLADGLTRAKGIHHCKFEYFPEDYSEVADSTQVRRFFGTKHGTLRKSVEGGAVMTATYREDGHLLAKMDALGATTQWERDARGRVTKVVDPLGRVTTITRDAAGLPVDVVDAAGGVSRIERDRFGNVTLYADALGGVMTAHRESRGLVAQILDARGGLTRFTHDEQGNLAEVIDPKGGVWRYAHDALGRRLAALDPTGAETRYAYSARGEVVAVYDAAGGVTRYVYDGEGHVTRILDAKGRATELLWGGYHKLSARTDAGENVVRLAYNLEGELVRVLNERGEEHRLFYDASGKLIGETTFDGRELRYKNDAVGRPIGMTSGLRRKTTLTYDGAGQLVARELPDGSVEEFDYDLRGAMIAARFPAGEVRFERDAVGRIVREVQRVGEEEHAVEVTYDPAGERAGRRTSLGHVEAIERDAMGARRRTVLDEGHSVEHARDALGREIRRGLPGGGQIESMFDPLGRLSRRRVHQPTLHRSMSREEPAWVGAQAGVASVEKAYRYDWDGELIESWDQQHGRTEYQYDPVGQLLAMVPEKARGEVFRYDPAGNLFESGAGAPERVYGKGNRLERRGNTTYTWDDDGRLVAKVVRGPAGEQRWKYRWNGSGLLQAATGPDGTVVEFGYDPFARRVDKRVSKPTAVGGKPVPMTRTRFVWDGDVLVHEIAEAAQAGGDPVVEVKTYCFEDDGFEPVAHREKGEWFHYVNDAVGAPEHLVDGQGRVALELRREAWGRVEAAAGARAGTPIRYQGQYEDHETGLFYNRFRYYDPDLGQYLAADPIRLAGGLHGFNYGGSTLGWIDPLGLARRPRSLEDWHGPKPTYINPGHHDPESPNFRGCGGKTTPLPSDAAEVYRTAVPDPGSNGTTWWGRNSAGDYYRYQGSNGEVHWNGTTNTSSERAIPRVPPYVRRRLGG